MSGLQGCDCEVDFEPLAPCVTERLADEQLIRLSQSQTDEDIVLVKEDLVFAYC